MVIVGTLLMILTVLCFWRKLHHLKIEKEFKYSLFALRDELRRKAIEGMIESDNPVFKYIDHTLSRTIGESYAINLLELVLSSIRVAENEDFKKFNENLQKALAPHPEIKKIMDNYYKALGNYVIGQHYIGFTVFLKPIFVLLMGANVLRAYYRRALLYAVYDTDDNRIIKAYSLRM